MEVPAVALMVLDAPQKTFAAREATHAELGGRKGPFHVRGREDQSKFSEVVQGLADKRGGGLVLRVEN
jgi:hypothetical protein